MEPTKKAHARMTEPSISDTHWCTRCGSATQPQWIHCGNCGHVLEGHVRPPEGPGTLSILEQPIPVVSHTGGAVEAGLDDATRYGDGRREHRRTARIAALVAMLTVLLALAGLAGYWQYRTSSELDATRVTLAQTRTDLGSTRQQLAESESQLGATRDELRITADELSSAQDELAVKIDRLAGLRGTLDNANNRLDLQANQIETLKSCLNGVGEALGHIVYSDYYSAAAALSAVEVSCERAFAMF